MIGRTIKNTTGDILTEELTIQNCKINILEFYAKKENFDYHGKQSLLLNLITERESLHKEKEKYEEKLVILNTQLSKEDIQELKLEIQDTKNRINDIKGDIKNNQEQYATLFNELSDFKAKYAKASSKKNLKETLIASINVEIEENKKRLFEIESQKSSVETNIQEIYDKRLWVLLKISFSGILTIAILILGLIYLPLFPWLIISYSVLLIGYILSSLITYKKQIWDPLRILKTRLLDLKNKKFDDLKRFMELNNSINKISFEFDANDYASEFIENIEGYSISEINNIVDFITNLTNYTKSIKIQQIASTLFWNSVVNDNDLYEIFDKYNSKVQFLQAFNKGNLLNLSEYIISHKKNKEISEYINDLIQFFKNQVSDFETKNLIDFFSGQSNVSENTILENRFSVLNDSSEVFLNIDENGNETLKLCTIYGNINVLNNEDVIKCVKKTIGNVDIVNTENSDELHLLKIWLGFSPNQIAFLKQ